MPDVAVNIRNGGKWGRGYQKRWEMRAEIMRHGGWWGQRPSHAVTDGGRDHHGSWLMGCETMTDGDMWGRDHHKRWEMRAEII